MFKDLLPIALGICWAASANAHDEQDTVQPIDVAGVVSAFRGKNNLSAYKVAASSIASNRSIGQSERFPGAPKIAVEAELSPRRSTDDNQLPGSATVRLAQSVAVGIDPARASGRFAALANAEVLERSFELVEQEREVVLIYVAARKELAVHQALETARADVERLASQAAQAAKLGTLGLLPATKARLLLDELTTNVEQSHLAYGAHVEQLSSATGLELSTKIGALAFAGLADEFGSEASTEIDGVARMRAFKLQEEAFAVERDVLLSRREVELSAGVRRSWGDLGGETSLLVEVALPLGAGAAARTEAAALTGERAALDARRELARKSLEREIAKAKADVTRLLGIVQRTEQRALRLEASLQRTSKAFRQGQAEVSEVLEILSELIEARVETARERAEFEGALVERRYIFVDITT